MPDNTPTDDDFMRLASGRGPGGRRSMV